MKLLVRFRSKLKRRKTFLRILTYFIVASVTVLSLSTLFLYKLSSRTIVDGIGSHMEDSMQKAAYNTSYMMNWSLSYAQRWSRDSSLVSYALSNQEDHYEDFKAWQTLRKIQTNNPLIESIYLVNGYTNTVVDTRSGVYATDEFYDKEMLKLLQPQSLRNIHSLIPRTMEGKLNDIRPISVHLLSFVFPYEPNQSSSSLVINFEEQSLIDLFGKNFSESASSYMLLDETGTIMASQDPGLFLQKSPFYADIIGHKPSSGWVETAAAGGKSLLVYADLSFAGHERWRIASLIPEDQLLGNVQALRNWTLLFYIPVVLATLFVVWLLAKKIYFPIRRLLEDVPVDETTYDRAEAESELSVLSEFYRKQQTRIDRLSDTWRNYKNDTRNELLRGLLAAKSNEPVQMMAKRFADLGLRIPLQSLQLAIGRIDRYDSLAQKYSEADIRLLRYAMTNIVEETLAGYALDTVDLGHDRFAVIIGAEEAFGDAELADDLRVCQSQIKDYLGVRISLTVSPVIESYIDLHDSYKATLLQSEERFFLGHGQISFAPAASMETTAAYKYPEEKERKILNAVKLGHEDEAIRHLRAFVEEATGTTVSEGRLSLTHLILNIGKTMQQIRSAEGDEQPWNLRSIQGTMDRLETAEAVTAWIETQIRGFLERQRSAANRTNRTEQTVQEMMDLIGAQLTDPNLSSKWIADRMKMSLNYIRTLFKDEVGQPLADYIAEKRLEQVVRLLVETDRTVEEISTQMGFPAINSFYIAFKKKFGVTPIQYRKNHQK
ncbi:helix-turn-helix domain-containing protein [Cohnella soli]|uniref:Helix-turn-helix domain-containing protein n=1 Tax=Cohnella soli TaxID=425005 RepID=A0ABW0HTI2_9BACL